MFAESARVPWTFYAALLRIHVQIEAFLAVTAFAVLAKEPTLGHTAQIVLVQKFTVIALFA